MKILINTVFPEHIRCIKSSNWMCTLIIFVGSQGRGKIKGEAGVTASLLSWLDEPGRTRSLGGMSFSVADDRLMV